MEEQTKNNKSNIEQNENISSSLKQKQKQKQKWQKFNQSQSSTSRKKVGMIIMTRRNTTVSEKQESGKKDAGKIRRSQYASGRTHTLPVQQHLTRVSRQYSAQYQELVNKMKNGVKMKDKMKFGNSQHLTNPKARHERAKSYQEHRNQLQKQLQTLMNKKNKLQELRSKKSKLKIRLNQLQFQLDQMNMQRKKGSTSIKEGQSKRLKIQMENKQQQQSNKDKQIAKKTIKNLKRTKLRPLPLNIVSRFRSSTEGTQNRNEAGNIEDSDEQQTNYFYQAQLHHKCLNCRHFAKKIQDVEVVSHQKVTQIIQQAKINQMKKYSHAD